MAGRPEGGGQLQAPRRKSNRRLFRTPSHLLHALTHAMEAEELADRNGLLQGLDPRAKVAGAMLMVIAATMLHSLIGLALLFGFAVLLALASQIPLMRLLKQVWLGVLAFTGVIALPSPFLVPGKVVATLPVLDWTVSEQGLRSAGFLIGRAETAATFAALLVLTTSWPHVMKAMRALGVPVAVVAVLGMTHRYIFVLMTTAAQMMEARRARQLGPLKAADQRRLIAGSAGVLMSKTLAIAGDVHMAMIARGYRGEIRLIDDFQFRARDGVSLLLALLVPATIFWMQR
ncbi:MAG TPA: cobalt ECF transporter T component CbiQ [Ensifer sp.]|nr:cobalt ECF transporter T component CbiQ [Ensifer sp.]